MPQSPLSAYRVATIQQHEHDLFTHAGVDPYALMCQAGLAVFTRLRARWPKAQSLAIAVGPGQNGGDGLVIAKAAIEQGMRVQLVSYKAPITFTKAAAKAWQALEQTAAEHNQPNVTQIVAERSEVPRLVAASDVLVDAVFGIGLDRPFEGASADFFAGLQQAVTAHDVPVLAVDLPSGLHADTGRVNAHTLVADETVTFLGLKPGLLTGVGRAFSGEVHLAELGQPPAAAADIHVLNAVVSRPSKPTDGHKGRFGTVVVLAGNQGMSGAARLAAEAALRCGAGKVIVATHPGHAAMLNLNRPELMVYPVDDSRDVLKLLAQADALVIGPGLGRDRWTHTVWRALRHFEGPVVVDADGLHRLGPRSLQDNPSVITPHSGEAAAMLDCTAVEIEYDRIAAVRKLAEQYRSVAVLKGAGSLIADAEHLALCARGTPALATPGSGDVLSGLIGALLAGGLEPLPAAEQGVLLHAVAGEICAQHQGEWGVLASDLFSPN